MSPIAPSDLINLDSPLFYIYVGQVLPRIPLTADRGGQAARLAIINLRPWTRSFSPHAVFTHHSLQLADHVWSEAVRQLIRNYRAVYGCTAHAYCRLGGATFRCGGRANYSHFAFTSADLLRFLLTCCIQLRQVLIAIEPSR